MKNLTKIEDVDNIKKFLFAGNAIIREKIKIKK